MQGAAGQRGRRCCARGRLSRSRACSSAASLTRAGHHPGQLGDAVLPRDPAHAAARHLAVVGLGHDEVVVGVCRDLREVGDDDDLGGRARAASRAPTSSAARPPTPESTSSKTNVGTEPVLSPAPSRPRSRASPGTAHHRRRPCSRCAARCRRWRPARSRRRRRRAVRAGPAASTPTTTVAEPIARCASSSPIRFARALAALRRAASLRSAAAATRSLVELGRRARSSAVMRSSSPSSSRTRRDARLAPGDDLVDGVAVAAGELGQRRPALLHPDEPAGVEVDVGDVAGQVRGEVVDEVGDLGEASLEVGQGGVVGADLAERRPGRGPGRR